MMCLGRLRIAHIAMAALVGQQLSPACVDSAGTEKVWAGAKKAVVKVLANGTGSNCSTTGTGFVVSAQGHVLTAGHVVPTACGNLRLDVQFEGNQDTIAMRVARRSAHDAVLLEPEEKQSASEYIQVADSSAPEDSYFQKRVVVVSIYKEDVQVTYTAAKVDSVEMVGNVRGKWTLCVPAANPGRSGSPVLTEDAKAVAIFIERPGEQQDRARAIPMRYLQDLGLTALQKSGSPIHSTTTGPPEILYSFTLDYNADGFAGVANGKYVVDKNGVENVSNLPLLTVAMKAVGKELRTRKDFTPSFEAQPGYVFRPDEVKFYVASHNPPSGPLPTLPCSSTVSQDCY